MKSLVSANLLICNDMLDLCQQDGDITDIRDYVKKRKVSGGTRSDLGRQCRDTFASLKKTCRKNGISFWQYLMDRIALKNNIPPLPTIIRNVSLAGASP